MPACDMDFFLFQWIMDGLLNIIFHGLHFVLIGINCFGWMSKKLRKITLVCQLLTLSSWVGFGMAKGWWGYCPLTDLHWQVKKRLGENYLPADYVSYLLEHGFGITLPQDFISGLILGAFTLSFIVTVYLLTVLPYRANRDQNHME
jgi:hypothetical protein